MADAVVVDLDRELGALDAEGGEHLVVEAGTGSDAGLGRLDAHPIAFADATRSGGIGVEVDLRIGDALAAPNLTAWTAVKFAPASVTEVPPASGPEAGLTPLTVGAAVRGAAVV